QVQDSKSARQVARGVAIAASPTALWTLDFRGDVALRDPGTGRILRNLGTVGLAAPSGDPGTDNVLTADADGAWVVGADKRSVLRLEGGRVAHRIAVEIGDAPILAAGGDTLWVASGNEARLTHRLLRIDAGTGEVTATIDLDGHRPHALIPAR